MTQLLEGPLLGSARMGAGSDEAELLFLPKIAYTYLP
jgi:hypothetical protein